MKQILVYLFLFSACYTNAQHPILKSIQFTNTLEGQQIAITIARGNTCNGIRVFHSLTPELGFNQVGIIPGICGDSESDSRHTFVYESPVEFDSNYYYFEFGGHGISEIISTFYISENRERNVIRVLENSLIIYPKDELESITAIALNGKSLAKGEQIFNYWEVSLDGLLTETIIVLIRNKEGLVDTRKLKVLRF